MKKVIALVLMAVISCKNNSENISQNDMECACIDIRDTLRQYPQEGEVVASEKVKVSVENKSYFVTIDLVADRYVENEGKAQQIYAVRRTNKNSKFFNSFYFVLPSKYNAYWNDLSILNDSNECWIGFKKMAGVVKLYKIYSYKYREKSYGGGEIIVESVATKNHVVI